MLKNVSFSKIDKKDIICVTVDSGEKFAANLASLFKDGTSTLTLVGIANKDGKLIVKESRKLFLEVEEKELASTLYVNGKEPVVKMANMDELSSAESIVMNIIYLYNLLQENEDKKHISQSADSLASSIRELNDAILNVLMVKSSIMPLEQKDLVIKKLRTVHMSKTVQVVDVIIQQLLNHEGSDFKEAYADINMMCFNSLGVDITDINKVNDALQSVYGLSKAEVAEEFGVNKKFKSRKFMAAVRAQFSRENLKDNIQIGSLVIFAGSLLISGIRNKKSPVDIQSTAKNIIMNS